MLFQFPLEAPFSAQISNSNSELKRVWLFSPFPVASTTTKKKKKQMLERQVRLPSWSEVSSEMNLSHTSIRPAACFLYRTSLHSRYMTQPSGTVSTCAAQWKMWLIKVFAVICKFLVYIFVIYLMCKEYFHVHSNVIPAEHSCEFDLTDFTAVCAAQNPQDGKKHVWHADKHTLYFMHTA